MGQQKRGRWKGQFTKRETSEAAPGAPPPPPPAPAEPQGPDLLSPRDLQSGGFGVTAGDGALLGTRSGQPPGQWDPNVTGSDQQPLVQPPGQVPWT